jgi:hypothetical protein
MKNMNGEMFYTCTKKSTPLAAEQDEHYPLAVKIACAKETIQPEGPAAEHCPKCNFTMSGIKHCVNCTQHLEAAIAAPPLSPSPIRGRPMNDAKPASEDGLLLREINRVLNGDILQTLLNVSNGIDSPASASIAASAVVRLDYVKDLIRRLATPNPVWDRQGESIARRIDRVVFDPMRAADKTHKKRQPEARGVEGVIADFGVLIDACDKLNSLNPTWPVSRDQFIKWRAALAGKDGALSANDKLMLSMRG